MLAAQVNAQGATQRLEFNPRTFSFSIAERDRRWAAVRAVMARPAWNLEAITTAASDLPGNTARYLTQIGMRMGGGDGAEVIFPRDPAQAVYVQVSGTRFRDFWKAKAGGWMADGKLAVSAEGGAQALAKQMAAQGLNRPGTRIGVAKLAGSRFDPEGLVAATILTSSKPRCRASSSCQSISGEATPARSTSRPGLRGRKSSKRSAAPLPPASTASRP